MNRTHVVKVIAEYLALLKHKVGLLNGLNMQDDNVQAEFFFRDLLNLAFDYELDNINIVEANAQAIDLGDVGQRFAIQVTSTNDFSKIRSTHEGFVKGGLETKYDELVVLIIGDKKAYKEKSLGGNGVFPMSITDNVWDIHDLSRKLGAMPLEKLKSCCDFLRAELRIAEPPLVNEVATLLRLIEVLSAAEEAMSIGDNREDPDPEGKIRDRFAQHAEFLQRRYVDLHEVYGKTLATVVNESDLGHVKIRKLQLYLMHWSDSVLIACGGDPQAALEVLTNTVLRDMGASAVPFDDGAVRYYLIDQLIACNVFPNKRPINA